MAGMRPSPRTLLDPVHLLALGFGTGLSPWAPGTLGTLLGLAAAWLMAGWPLAARLAIAAAAVAAGFWICGESAERLGSHDDPAIVWDEIAAMLALALAVPAHPLWYLAAFVLFRVFDIVKPWPIRDVDHRLPGGAGIMLDDLIAAGFAALILVLFRLVPTVS